MLLLWSHGMDSNTIFLLKIHFLGNSNIPMVDSDTSLIFYIRILIYICLCRGTPKIEEKGCQINLEYHCVNGG
jgi:hypothetical protein